MVLKLDELEQLGTAPIPGAQPAGIDLRGDDDFDWIEESYHWLNALKTNTGVRPVGGPADPTWDAVGERAIKVLREKSKDMRIAVYLSFALFHETGLSGLSIGLAIVRGLIENFWETMYPPLARVKIRTNAIEHMNRYLAEGDEGGKVGNSGRSRLRQLSERLQTDLTKTEEQAELQKLEAELKGIDASLVTLDAMTDKNRALFPPDLVPNFINLRESLQNLLFDYQAESNRHKPGGEATGDSESASTPPPAASPTRASGMPSDDAVLKPDDIRKLLKRAAPVLRELDPSDPAPYRLLRLGVWGGLATLPPRKEGEQVTRVPPGPVQPALVEALTKLQQASNWLVLLNQAETKVGDSPLWLDLQYFVHSALRGLGPAFEPAANAVADETANLLRRLPGLEGLSFATGIPFASNATLAWLNTLGRAPAAEGGVPPAMAIPALASPGNSDGSKHEESMAEARRLASQGKTAEAITLLRGQCNQAATRRERFRIQTGMASLLLEARKPRLVLPILEGLAAEIDRFELETWDPELSLAALVPLLMALKSEKTQEGRMREIFGRICRLDPEMALKLE